MENRFAKYASGNRFAKYTQQPKPEMSIGDAAKRFAGLTARAGAQGVSFPPRLLADTAVEAVDLFTEGDLPSPSAGFADFLSDVGLPEPQTGPERVYSDAVEGAAGGALFGPLMAIPGATGGASMGVTREAGGGPVAQFIASLAGGSLPAGARALGNVAGKAVDIGKDLIAPFTQGGRETIVGRTLRDQASDPAAAIENMRTAPEFVPGSKPTSGVASRDPGLLGVERGMRNRNPSDFADVDTQNMTARNQALDDIAGQPADIKKAKEARAAGGDKGREAAFANKTPVKLSNTRQVLGEIQAAPEGSREAVAKALKWVDDRIGKLTPEGSPDLPADPEFMYAARQDIADAIAGKFDSEQPALRLASKELAKIRDALDDDIELGAEGYQAYMKKFADDSKPIAQMETLQDIRTSAETAVPNPLTGERALSQAKWTNLVGKNRADLAKTMTPEQMKVLDAISADLDRGASLGAFRAGGSDTVQNLTMGNLLGNLLSGQSANSPFMRTATRPLSFLYKIPEEAAQNLLLDAMKDPQTAALLMSKVSTESTELLSRQLMQRAKEAGYGAAISGTVNRAEDKEPVVK